MFDPAKPNFGGSPASPWRTKLSLRPVSPDTPPVVSIVTPCLTAGDPLLAVAETLRGQSLQAFEWILLADRDAAPERIAPIAALAEEDPRIRLFRTEGPLAVAATQSAVRQCRAPFIALVAPNEQLEPTALESLCACLASFRELGFVAGRSAVHGERYLALDGAGAALEEPSELCPSRLVVRRALLLELLDGDPGAADASTRAELIQRLRALGARGATIPAVFHWIPWREPGRPHPAGSALGEIPSDPAAGILPGPDEPLLANPLAPRRKRIICILPRILAAEASAAIFAQALQLLGRQGWQLTVVALHDGDAAAEITLARLTPDIHVFERFLRAADWPRYLLALLESRRPQAVLFDAAHLPGGLTRYARARHPGPRYIALHHLDPDEPELQGPCRPAEACDEADLLLSSSTQPGTNGAESPRPAPSRRWLPVCADTLVWRPRAAPRTYLRPQWGVGEDIPVLLFAGSLADRSRLALLVSTLSGLVAHRARFFAVIVGDGSERPWLEQELRTHGLDAWVRLLGPASPDLLLRTLAAVDLFFTPSHSGFASVLVQAMAMELPVVASEVDEHRFLVTPACGRLVPPGQDECRGFLDALLALLADSELRRQLGKQARQRVLLYFAPDRLLQQLESALDQREDHQQPKFEVSSVAVFADAVAAAESAREHEAIRNRSQRLERNLLALANRCSALERDAEAARRNCEHLEAQHAQLAERFEQQGREYAVTRGSVQDHEEQRVALEAELLAARDAAAKGEAAIKERAAALDALEEKYRELQRECRLLARELRASGARWWRPRALARQADAIGRRLGNPEDIENPS